MFCLSEIGQDRQSFQQNEKHVPKSPNTPKAENVNETSKKPQIIIIDKLSHDIVPLTLHWQL
jgi:hypothetical protein